MKVQFKIILCATIPYERTVWHFQHFNSDHINSSIDLFDWESALNNLDANEQASVLNSTTINITTNFALKETITCN